MKRCIICGKIMKTYKLDQLVECPACNYICADMDLDSKHFKKLYNEKFWRGGSYTDYQADEEILRSNFRRRIKDILKFISKPEDKSVFEIGCAYGFFLDESSRIFKKAAGIDISESAISYAQHALRNNPNVKVSFGDYKELDLDKKVDLICLWDTIEHLSDPDIFIKKAYNDLKKRGVIAITTGDMGSVNAKLRGKRWRQYKPPIHMQYFTKKSMKKLLNKNKFDVLRVSHIWNEMSLNNALYIMLCIRSNHKKLYNFLVKIGIRKIKLYINLWDYLFVIARKRS